MKRFKVCHSWKASYLLIVKHTLLWTTIGLVPYLAVFVHSRDIEGVGAAHKVSKFTGLISSGAVLVRSKTSFQDAFNNR